MWLADSPLGLFPCPGLRLMTSPVVLATSSQPSVCGQVGKTSEMDGLGLGRLTSDRRVSLQQPRPHCGVPGGGPGTFLSKIDTPFLPGRA